MKKSIGLILALFITLMLSGQETGIRKVPKQYSLETGYRRVTGTEFGNSSTNGYTVLFDYAWQLSGLNGTKASYITVPLSYTRMMPDSDTAASVRVIGYGWTVRHELRKHSDSWVPFLGYSLMLNNYSEAGTDGRVFGHQTGFTLGLNHYGSSRFVPYLQINYSMTNYPEWGVKGSRKYNFIEAKIGIRL